MDNLWLTLTCAVSHCCGWHGGAEGITSFQAAILHIEDTVLEDCVAVTCSFGKQASWDHLLAACVGEVPHGLQAMAEGLRCGVSKMTDVV